ncbi:MAG: PAS domain S-box protein [Anaerolineaceae bacterium]
MDPTKILLIEDNAGDARLILELLREYELTQISIDQVDRLKTGLEHLAQNKPDVVLLDLGLPDSQGLNTLTQLNKNSPKIPIVILTGLDDTEQSNQAVKAGAQDYLLKSDINSGSLMRAIRYAIERKQAEEKLLLSEKKFKAVAELSPLAIYASYGSDQQGIFINESFYKLFGYSLEDVPTVGQWWIKAFPDEKYRQQVMDQWVYNIDQANKNNTDVEVLECTCICKDGSEKIIAWVGKTIGDEFWAFGYDLTERKQAEKAARESAKEFQSLAESMPQIVWATRPDGWNIYFNQQWVDYTGLTLEESYGQNWIKPFHPDDQKRAWTAWQNATQNNDIYSIECRLRRADGIYKWWLVRGVPMIDENGIIQKWFGTFTDIDGLKQAEMKLNEQLNELKRWQSVMLDREDRVQELKREVNELLAKNNQQPRYPSVTSGKRVE